MNDSRGNQTSELSDVIARIQSVDVDQISHDPEAKADLLLLARKLTASLEGSVNRATDLVFRPYTTIAARIAVDLNLFEHIASKSGSITSRELATLSKADELLIARILRLLATADFVEESGEDQWSANDTTRAMTSPPIAAGHRFVYDVLITSAIKAPKFLRETKYKMPTEPADTFVQYANQTKLNFFEYLHSIPPRLRDFNLFMGNSMGTREYWHDWYDMEGRLLNEFDLSQSSTLLVDVGGGKGHDLQSFYASFGKSSGQDQRKLVLQDLPHVVDAIPDAELPPTVVKMAHDFFTEQPVKAARGYFLHHILHDWSDKYCHQILHSLRPAMVPGYSKLLIHELILPNTGAVEMQARFDLVMMTLNGGMERSRTQWIKLLQDSGFCNIQIHEHLDHDGIIEAEVAPDADGPQS
ncbi:sterigmatocystin 8-O-methyltransferase [Pleomassaria siparia CBS 279.74]|uniref:Sterigmatocystin 8-O-methyltransferase n=1 Tax=Pleomassaria siparia CBS 279.74 TaxID=1314801 RepID=A0A6G1JR66_9PLEO|nr:sterigmatocystin 8-O-methyltransferase [Pleomassaria siparia CBS 279.74]